MPFGSWFLFRNHKRLSLLRIPTIGKEAEGPGKYQPLKPFWHRKISFFGQYQDGEISRHTFNWQIRGIRMKASGAGSPRCANFQNICTQWDMRITLSLRVSSQSRIGPHRIFSQIVNCRGCFLKATGSEPMPPPDRPCYLQADLLLRPAPEEGRELKRSDFCYKDRTLYIRKNKTHR